MPIKHPQAFGHRSVAVIVVLIGALVSAAAASLVGKAQAQGITVHMSPYCGCCGNWVEHLQQSGFTIEKRMVEDLTPMRTRYGVPADFASCHTAMVGDYVVEGHVPAADIRRLLEKRPPARGLAVPGMPASALGMERSGQEPYDALVFTERGNAKVFARHWMGFRPGSIRLLIRTVSPSSPNRIGFASAGADDDRPLRASLSAY